MKKLILVMLIALSFASCENYLTPILEAVKEEIKVYQCENIGCRWTIEAFTVYEICPRCHSNMVELSKDNFPN